MEPPRRAPHGATTNRHTGKPLTGPLRTGFLIGRWVGALGFLWAGWAGPGWCDDSPADQVARWASDATGPLLAAGEISLFFSGPEGERKAWQGFKALVVTGTVTELLKRTVREQRPNREDRKSFPSGHTSLAFAMATLWAEEEPKYQGWAYGAASVIGWSRVQLDEHYWWDVVAGAALGHFIAKGFATEPSFSLLSHHQSSPCVGLAFRASW